MWHFCANYCEERFGDEWHLSAEQSLLLHAHNTAVPTCVVVSSPRGKNNTIKLSFGASLYDLKVAQVPSVDEIVVKDGLRFYSPPAALMRVSEKFIADHPVETKVLLTAIRDAAEIAQPLLEGGRSIVAGRLAGAFRKIGRTEIANEILSSLRKAGYDVRETDPFTVDQPPALRFSAAHVLDGRVHAMWESMRGKVLEQFPDSPGLPENADAYLNAIDRVYSRDAYHSLSLEGFNVSPDLIERVRASDWDSTQSEADRHSRDARAASGYWRAFQKVKGNIAESIAHSRSGKLIRHSHRDWYREMTLGTIAEYRSETVYLRTSKLAPPSWEPVRDAMLALFDLLENESEPAVRAVLGHWLFGYINPYPEGNGRMARFLMNASLASAGYPWKVIAIEERAAYIAALDSASHGLDITPFAKFIAQRVRRSMDI
jgi:hypothetical protein